MEASRAALAAMISQIEDLDPYPCIFGIPVMVRVLFVQYCDMLSTDFLFILYLYVTACFV